MTSDDIVLVFTDIHADIAAIKSIFKCAASSEFISRFGTVNRVINLGDVVGRGYFPAEAIDFIQNLDLEVVSLLGNHDESVMYNWPVAGDDSLASKIHDEFKKKGEYSDYFKDLKEVYIDSENHLLCVHGGPIDPDFILPSGLSSYDKWLYQRTWQRLDPAKSYYNPYTGYRYTPDMAFEHARKTLVMETKDVMDNILIFTGHQHREAVYRKQEENIANIHALIKSSKESIKCLHHKINFSEFVIEDDSSYLVRFGLAGPVGYHFYTLQFGIFYMDEKLKQRKIALLEFDYSKEAEEEQKRLNETYGWE